VQGNPGQTPGPVYVVGDVHGHRAALADALRGRGLLDAEDAWAGGSAHLWFLGDFVDRGPDGIGVIDLVMGLSAQAEAAGGKVETLLGNHEILLLGMHRFGETEVPSDFGPRSFARSWEMNGGLRSDQDGLTAEHVEWLVSRPVLALVGDDLLMHSDTLEYLAWGTGIEEINAGVQEVLRGEDIVEWWDVWRRMTTRYAFRGPEGEDIADELMAALGGSRVVHGHSVIADQLGVLPADIDGPYSYAGGKVLGVDAGLFVGGPCLVVRLDTGADAPVGSARGDDPGAERDERDRDHLEVGDAERDADDGDAEGDAADDVADGQPPAREDDPDDVADD
jgi:hypothetical protein